MGHDVYKACGLHAAVELTCEIFPEFVLLDISVPSFDGLQLARRIRQLQLARQPFIVAATAWGGARAIG
jgi:CheY-like chemotaxis protein